LRVPIVQMDIEDAHPHIHTVVQLIGLPGEHFLGWIFGFAWDVSRLDKLQSIQILFKIGRLHQSFVQLQIILKLVVVDVLFVLLSVVRQGYLSQLGVCIQRRKLLAGWVLGKRLELHSYIHFKFIIR
jgi:hypothetical protein